MAYLPVSKLPMLDTKLLQAPKYGDSAGFLLMAMMDTQFKEAQFKLETYKQFNPMGTVLRLSGLSNFGKLKMANKVCLDDWLLSGNPAELDITIKLLVEETLDSLGYLQDVQKVAAKIHKTGAFVNLKFTNDTGNLSLLADVGVFMKPYISSDGYYSYDVYDNTAHYAYDLGICFDKKYSFSFK